jgi:hypothetical protein
MKDIIHAVSCITNTLNKVTSEIESGVNAVKGVLGDIGDLTSLTKSLEQEENGDDEDQTDTQSASESDSQTSTSEMSTSSASRTSSSSSSSSSRSCTQSSVTQDFYVECSPTIVAGSANVSFVTQECTTSTSTVSGCDITAFTITPTASETGSYATDIVTFGPGNMDSPLDDVWISSVMSEIGANATYKSNGTAIVNSTSSFALLPSGGSTTGTSSSVVLSSDQTTFITTTSSIFTAGSSSQPEHSTILSSSSSSSSSLTLTSISKQPPSSTAPPPPPPPPPTSTTALPPPWKTGVCSVHIKESVKDGAAKTFDMTAEIKDAEGNSLGSTSQTIGWAATVIVHSKLPYDVDITFTTRTMDKRTNGTSLWRRLGGGYVPPPPNLFEKNIVIIQANHKWYFDTTQTDPSKLPYISVGGWDNSKSPVVSFSYLLKLF